MVAALLKEIEIREGYLGGEAIGTIYFGGGTPSLLEIDELRMLLERARWVHSTEKDLEITLETNPDDMTAEKLEGWKEIGINRLSVGIQSFFDEDLRWMNRAHNAEQASNSLSLAKQYFDNLTIDLIYGTPSLTHEKWKQNVETAIALGIPHLSCYALTVEAKTPLQKMIRQGKLQDVDPDKQSEQFSLLMNWLETAGYEQYEISNFARPGFRSRHNSSYWQGKKYLGIGPSAHSYDRESRQWNVSNNQQYIASIRKGIIPFEREVLTPVQQLNEYIMTSLRTGEGLDLSNVEKETKNSLTARATKYVNQDLAMFKGDFLVLTKEGRLLADGIAAALFFDQ